MVTEITYLINVRLLDVCTQRLTPNLICKLFYAKIKFSLKSIYLSMPCLVRETWMVIDDKASFIEKTS